MVPLLNMAINLQVLKQLSGCYQFLMDSNTQQFLHFFLQLLTEIFIILSSQNWTKLECGTYCTRNGKNGASIFIVKEGRISASRIAPVEVGLHSRVELSSECEELSSFNSKSHININRKKQKWLMISVISQ